MGETSRGREETWLHVAALNRLRVDQNRSHLRVGALAFAATSAACRRLPAAAALPAAASLPLTQPSLSLQPRSRPFSRRPASGGVRRRSTTPGWEDGAGGTA